MGGGTPRRVHSRPNAAIPCGCVRKNPGFLVSIPALLLYVKEAFARRPDLRELQEVLGRHVPEIAA